MNRFFTLLLAASCLTAVGQGANICEYPELLVPRVVFLDADSDGVWIYAQSDDPLIWDSGPTGDSLFVQECGTYDVRELVEIEGLGQLPCGFSEEVLVLTEDCLGSELEFFCGDGTVYDVESGKCIVANPSDSNFDGCVQLNDLLDLLSAYGDCGAEESSWQCGETLEYQGYDYETVQIGEQCWFAENLRAENFENGEAIPTEFTEYQWAAWQSLQLPGSFVYGENQGECASWAPDFQACDTAVALSNYGRLYNGFAVDDERGLCPSGWHVPEDFEFGILVNTVGGVDVAGLALKSSTGWGQNGNCCIGLDGNGTNEYGFNGLPGGTISGQGYSGNAGLAGSWWTSTSASYNADYTSKYRIATAQEQSLPSNDSYMGAGRSVRCIKD